MSNDMLLSSCYILELKANMGINRNYRVTTIHCYGCLNHLIII